MHHTSFKCKPLIHNGFTLIELLVVISIIAVLAGLLLPGVNLVRANAKTSKCANAQRQVVLACYGYANDQAGGLPATRVNNMYWYELIEDYLEGKKSSYYQGTVIRGCPEFTFDLADTTAFSYGTNTFLAYGGGGNSNNLHNRIGGSMGALNFTEFNAGTVTKQTSRVYFADTDAFWTGSSPPVTDLEVRHRGKLVVTFVDGHGGRQTLAEATAGVVSPP